MMTCERIEGLLSAYLEGELAAAAFPEVEPSPELMARLYAIPLEKGEKKRFFRPVFDWLVRPALQPVYAAATGLLIVLSFVLFHPEGRGVRKAIDTQFHRGIGTVEKLYADAGGIKGEVRAVSANVIKSFNTLGLLKGDEKKQ
jgi:antirestriction protein ArdC